MTNNTIILDEVFNRFTAEQRAELVHKIYTPEQVNAFMLRLDFHGADVAEDEKQDTAAAHLLADSLHTFSEWKKAGKSVKQGEHAALVCYLWKYSDKPHKNAQSLKETAGDENAEESDGYFYKTKSHLFGAWQVESTEERDKRTSAVGRFKSREELIAYNKKLAEERRAQKAKAEAEDDFSDINPAEVKRQLEQRGFVNGLLVNGAVESPLVKMVEADVARLTAAQNEEEQPAEVVAILPAATKRAPVAQFDGQLDFESIAAGLLA